MTARERLDRYLDALRRRLRTHIYVQTLAAMAAGVLLVTCAAVWLLKREEFAPGIALSARIAIGVLAIVIAALLWWTPLRRLRREDGARIFEERMPQQQGRVQTYLDSKRAQANASPLIDLLADDAAELAEKTPVGSIVSSRRIGVGAAIGVAALAALAMLLVAGPGHWGFGSRHLLLGAELPRDAVPVRRVTVAPGDATVRRNSDLAIRASIEGFHPQDAQVFVRFADQEQWERAPMQAAAEDRSEFEFRLYAVRGPLSYYVDAEGTRSPEHSVSVVDLPKIQRVRLTYDYPDWTGLKSATDEEVRDIRAVAGTNVKVEVFADAPLEAPALIVDGAASELAQQDRASVGAIEVKKPGSYQIGARVAGEFVALSDEYAIEIVPDEKPVVEISKPGRDWRATSIEEVPVHVQAQDDFRLRNVELRYSVNGGEWQSLPMGGGAQQTDKASLLRLEELGVKQPGDAGLIPGDLVSYYAVARDRRHAAQTDLFMVQVQPFERTFRQAQGGGAGAGGMSDEQGAISERQKEILLATWNLQRNDERNGRSRQQLRASATMLAELQATLAQQARTLSARTRARASLDDERIRTFVESLERAAAAMDPAARHLNDFKLAEAVPVEQQALQQLLRAESAFREVQVSMQQNSSAGGAQASRNFAEMFELEMDLEKNQYESESQLSMQNEQQELDEAIRKLKELAERQERLAQEANRSAMRAEEQRWKQEQLRREAEDLRRRLAEMNRRQQQQGSQSSQAANNESTGESRGESSGERSGEPSNEPRSASSRESDEERNRSELAEALESVNRALEDMRAANERGQGDQTDATQSAREAGQNLRRALRQIDQPAPSGLDETLEQLAERTQGIGEEQRRIESDLYRALAQTADRFNSRGSIDRGKAQELVQSKQQLAAEMTELQRDLRRAVHEHRSRTPETTRRVGEIIRDLEASDVMYRINRSAAEIYYGRAREAALREGLISEALETLEHDLREASAQAAREGEGRDEGSTPERLLAETAEMRRALQAGRSLQPGDAEAQRGPRQDGPLQDGQSQQVQARQGQSQEGQSQQGESQVGAQRGFAPGDVDAGRGSPQELQADWQSLARETEAIGQRVRDAANRMNRGELSQAEFDALRRRANELRRLAGNPMAEQREAMLKLIDQIELAALAAAPKSEDSAAARAALPSPDSPRYREAVAEYYRRLGSE